MLLKPSQLNSPKPLITGRSIGFLPRKAVKALTERRMLQQQAPHFWRWRVFNQSMAHSRVTCKGALFYHF